MRCHFYLRAICFLFLYGALASSLTLARNAPPADPFIFRNSTEEQRFQKLTQELRCLVCQNETLADSNADLAKDLRKEVFDMVQSGKTNAEIKDYLTIRYSDFVLYEPPVKKGTFLLWFGPALLLLVGVIALIFVVRRHASPMQAPLQDEEDW